jgi:predicted nucleotide-binding protein
MILKELQILCEALWEAVKTDLKLFSPIQLFSRKLAEYDFSELEAEDVAEIQLYSNKIEDFFDGYRSKGDGLYFPPNQTSNNDDTVKKIKKLTDDLGKLSSVQLGKEVESVKPKQRKIFKREGKVFIGHGRNKIWARLQVYLQDELDLEILTFESESRTSESIVSILTEFLETASFAILVMTAEDETGDGNIRARQNVIHESGLFQGRLGFGKVIILKEDKTENFSNIAGLQYIPFSGDNIEQTFYELQRTLKKQGLLK